MTPPSPLRLRVLLVATQPEDAEEVRLLLETPPAEASMTVVTGFAEAASVAAWHDIVIVSHPSADAAGALRKALVERRVTAPVMLLLPALYESQAAEAVASGVDAVVVRDGADGWRQSLPGLLATLVRRSDERRAREDAESALRTQQDLFDGFMRHSPAIAYMKDEEGRYRWVNAAFERMFGLAPADWQGRSDIDIWGEEAGTRLRENDLAVLAAGEALEVEEVVPQDDGIHHWLAFKFPWREGKLRLVGGMAVDVTPLRRAEEERRQVAARLEQARRLESLGGLAASIAHDFNNLLVSIMGNASLAAMEVPEGSPAARFLEQVEQSAVRAAQLTHQLFTLSGRASLLLEVASVSDLVEQHAFRLRSDLPQGARLRLEIAGDGVRVQADRMQLDDLLTTLVARAAQSLGASGGTVILRTGCVDLSADDLPGLLLGDGLAPGRHTFIEVEDDGPGLDEAALAGLFEPDFAARPSGRATGLSAALGLVRGHGGAIEVDSQEGRGTRIRVVLPEAPAAEASRPAPEPAAPASRSTVLVVDDDEPVRSVARAALQRYGWTALTARDGEEALEIFKEMGDQVGAVLLDTTMPGLSGIEVLKRMKAMRPDVKVVLTSGYEQGEVAQRSADQPPAGFLQKPYRPATLLETLRQLVDERDP